MAPDALAVGSLFRIDRTSRPPECDGRIGGRCDVFLRLSALDYTVFTGDTQLESDDDQPTNDRGIMHGIPRDARKRGLVAKCGGTSRL